MECREIIKLHTSLIEEKDDRELITTIKGKLLLTITALGAVFTFFSAYSIWVFGEENELVISDAAIVLGNAVWEGEPSPVLRERINHAIWLYENDYVEKIIFTGGKTNGELIAESEVSRDYAIRHNVPPEDILIETESLITETNFIYANEIAMEHNLNTFLVVSDPLHMKRALLMARIAGVEANSSPTTSSEYSTLATKLPFFMREVACYVGYVLTLPFR
jgi:uncharacterized SAM-binding protein YcdF (DUF218 family)